MFRNFQFSFFTVLVAVTMVSCVEGETNTSNYDNWEQRNTEYFEARYREAQDSINAGSKNWKLLKSIYKDSGAGVLTDYVIAHVLECPHSEGDNVQQPLVTDSVYVHYRGKLIPRDSYVRDTTTYAIDGVQFDTSYYGETLDFTRAVPSKFLVGTMLEGVQTALVNMHVYDRWEVIVPYTMGYGAASSNSAVPSYSTLRFDIFLTYIGKPGKKMPALQ